MMKHSKVILAQVLKVCRTPGLPVCLQILYKVYMFENLEKEESHKVHIKVPSAITDVPLIIV